MSEAQINTEMTKTKNVMNKLQACVEAGDMSFYKELIDVSAYYLKLSKHKPVHNLTIV